jgi:hypothetical protein
LVDGEVDTREYFSFSKEDGAEVTEALLDDLVVRHVWNDDTFATFDTPGIVNVKDAAHMNGHPAVGDGVADDTAALEYAVANHRKIFLPKGTYRISRTLTLGADTQIFGVARTLTTINADNEWSSGEDAPLIDTVDDPDARTTVSHLAARSRTHGLSWRAGMNSRVRSVSPREVHIHGNGGGRWTAIFNVGSQFLVEGTSQPLLMYAVNPERARDPQFEIRNARNVQVFFLKSEAGFTERGGNVILPSVPLKITKSRNVAVFGGTGNIDLASRPGSGMIEVTDCEDILCTHVRPWKGGPGWFTIKEVREGVVQGVGATHRLALYRRGEP